MSNERVAIQLDTLTRLADGFRESRGITGAITTEQMIEMAKDKVGGEEKFKQLLNRTITEITAEDLKDSTVIPQYSLQGCKNLKKITIPNTVVTFGSSCFNSTALEETRYEGELWEWCKIKRSGISFTANYGTLYINGEVCENVEIRPTDEMLTTSSSGVSQFVVEANAFYNVQSLKTLKFVHPGNRYALLSRAFGNCSNLSRVDICSERMDEDVGGSYSSYTLPSNLFVDCSNLTDIYVCWSEGKVKNAPWGATNATIHYDTPSQILIGGKKYSFKITMNWEEWCNSEYNTDGFYIDENDSNFVKNADGLYVKYRYDSSTLRPSIKSHKCWADYEYYLEANL